LLDETAACAGDSLAGVLESFLGLAHEAGLDSAGSDQLSSRGCNVVGCNNQLLRGVAASDDTICSLDEQICAIGDSLRSRDETLCPAVIFLIEALECSKLA
jgi:hypothetical protein